MTIAEKKLLKNENLLIYMCLFMYLMMMAAKSIFSAEIEVIRNVFETTKSETSLANLFYYLAYAVMQVVLVFLVDKLNIKIYLGITVTLSALISVSIGIVGSLGIAKIGFIYIMFTLNGFLQAGIYGCSIKLFNRYLSKEKFYLGVKLISGAQIIATILSYGLSSLFIALGRWEMPFIIIGAMFVGSAVLFVTGVSAVTKNIKTYRLQEEEEKHIEHKEETRVPIGKETKQSLVVFLIIIAVITLLSNATHYSLNTWFTSILKDEYKLPEQDGTLLTMGISLILSIVSIVSVGICAKAKNYYVFSIIGFFGAVIFSLVLSFVFKAGMILLCVLSVSFMVLNRWAKVPYSSVTSYKLRECLEPGKYSLLINAVASVAAGAGPYVVSLIQETFGWSGAYIAVSIMSAIVVVMVVLVMLLHNKLFNSLNKDKQKQNLENN